MDDFFKGRQKAPFCFILHIGGVEDANLQIHLSSLRRRTDLLDAYEPRGSELSEVWRQDGEANSTRAVEKYKCFLCESELFELFRLWLAILKVG